MYLHLGQETLVKTDEVVGVFDLDSATLGKRTREFLAESEKAGRVVNVSTELPKSFVLAQNGTLYISQLGSATLKKRLDSAKKNYSGMT